MSDAQLVDACERASLRFLTSHPRTWSVEFRRRWRADFAWPEVDWRRAKFDWEPLGTEQAPALRRRAAIRAFDTRRKEARTAYVTRSTDYEEVLEIEGTLPDHAWWRSAVPNNDLYIVHAEWNWSFVLTHEESAMGIGPFFVTNLRTSE